MTDHTQHWSEDVRRLNPHLVPNVNRAIRAEDHAASIEARRALQISEHDMQASLFDWAEQVAGQVPELEWLHAIPNGQYRRGQRPEPGLRAGVPDVMLPVMRYSKRTKAFHGGLYLELKVGDNTTAPEQERWLRYLQAAGYMVAVVHDDWRRAANLILEYLGRKRRLDTND